MINRIPGRSPIKTPTTAKISATVVLSDGLQRFSICEPQPRLDDGVRVERHRFDSLGHKPFGQARVVARTLAADLDILACTAAGLDGHRQHIENGGITFVKGRRDEPRVAVQAECELGHVAGTDREPVQVLQELAGEDSVGRQLTS